MSNVFRNQGDHVGKLLGLLRYQFSGRSNWRRMLRESGLPEPVQDVIDHVTRQSKLMRFEKADVTDELIAHFQDGALSGHSYEKLVQDFGDPANTAKLIRNSKIRNRPMFMKFGRISALLGLGAVGTYVVALILFNLGKPNPSTDYLGEFNAPVDEIAEEDKAWNVYRDVWAKYGFCEGQNGHFEEIYFLDPEHEDHGRLLRPDDEGWEKAVAKLEDSADLLNSFRQGSKLPRLGLRMYARTSQYPPEDRAALFPDWAPEMEDDVGIDGLGPEATKLANECMIAVLLPHIQSFRKAARILIVDSRLAKEQEDVDRVVQNIEAIMGMSRHAADQGFLVCGLVGIAVNGMGYDLIDEMLADNPDFFSEDQLRRIQDSIEAAEPVGMVDFRGERLFVKDFIQRVYTDDGKGDGRMTPVGLELLNVFDALYEIGDSKTDLFGGIMRTKALAGPASMIYMASRKEMTEKLDELMDRVESKFDSPFWEGQLLDDIDEELEANSRKYALLAGVFPAASQIYYAKERALANRDGMLLAIAAHRYRLRHGHWPESTNDVVGAFLEQTPIDRVDGQPLKLRQEKEEFRVYSIGLDRDDDQGRYLMITRDGAMVPPGVDADQWGQEHDMVPMPARNFTFVSAKHLDGDWVIWPRHADH